jgi:hypothetical protein
MANRVNARMKTDKASSLNPPINRILPEAQLEQLPSPHHPMLPSREFRDRRISTARLQ